jgi:4'-phosphopantetheinyl transferase
LTTTPAPLPGTFGDVAPGEVRVYTIDGDREVERALRRRILADCLQIPEDRLEIAIGEKGKPTLVTDPDLHFSVSHTGNVSMLALTRVAPVGIDVERIRTVPFAEKILRRFFPDVAIEEILSSDHKELRFVRAWTTAEATVKIRGASVWEAATPDPTAVVRELTAPDGYAAAVAVAAPDWYVTQHDYPPIE